MRSALLRHGWFWLLPALGCAPATVVGAGFSPGQPPTPRAEPEPEPAPAPAPAPATPPPGADAPACRDMLDGELARVSCDASRVLTAHPVELHPDRPVPDEPARGVLARVGELMREQPEILLLRIEVALGEDPGVDPVRRRAALATAQRRADALLHYLWRKRGVSAERLEAVAYEFDAKRAGGRERWPVTFRIVQRARR